MRVASSLLYTRLCLQVLRISVYTNVRTSLRMCLCVYGGVLLSRLQLGYRSSSNPRIETLRDALHSSLQKNREWLFFSKLSRVTVRRCASEEQPRKELATLSLESTRPASISCIHLPAMFHDEKHSGFSSVDILLNALIVNMKYFSFFSESSCTSG